MGNLEKAVVTTGIGSSVIGAGSVGAMLLFGPSILAATLLGVTTYTFLVSMDIACKIDRDNELTEKFKAEIDALRQRR